MEKLNEVMQRRLDKWLENKLPVKAIEKVKGPVKFSGRGHKSDVYSQEEMDEEYKRSQTKR